MGDWTHFDEHGLPRMVDIAEKAESRRLARAVAVVEMLPSTLEAIEKGHVKKGDVFGVATTAGVLAAKQSAFLIPMCHPIRLTRVSINFQSQEDKRGVFIEAIVEAFDRTGVEIEALVAASIAALTVIDMCKALDRTMSVRSVVLKEKFGGRSGQCLRKDTLV
jgi:cyclic pyranopterin phosphate synthase